MDVGRVEHKLVQKLKMKAPTTHLGTHKAIHYLVEFGLHATSLHKLLLIADHSHKHSILILHLCLCVSSLMARIKHITGRCIIIFV